MQGMLLLSLLPLAFALSGLGGGGFDEDGDDQAAIPGTDGADALHGTAAPDLIDAGAGADAISGFGGADTVLGGDGDDDISGSSGTRDDHIDAGAGDDTVRYVGDHSTVLGGAGNDVLRNLGVTGDGLVVRGGDGDDTIAGCGTLDGGAGDDVLVYDHGGVATMTGGEGADIFGVTGGVTTLSRDDAPVITDFDPAHDRILLNGVDGADLHDGLVRSTVVTHADGSTETLLGDPDAPLMRLQGTHALTAESFPQGFLRDGAIRTGTDGDDHLDVYPFHPWAGDDPLGGTLTDRVDAGAGDDVIDAARTSGPLGRLTLDGGDGDDSIFGGSGADRIDGGDGSDQLLDGPDGRPFTGAPFHFASDDDLLRGGAGGDTIVAGNGADTLLGGDGDDVLDDGYLTLDLGPDPNRILVDDAATLDGGAGDDTLTLSGGDVAMLGEGSDEAFVQLDETLPGDAGGVVTVTDFTPGEDRLGIHVAGPPGSAPPLLRTWAADDGSGLYVGIEGRDGAVAFLRGVSAVAGGDLSASVVPPDAM